jgi:putative SOS response-associated peptidase YedK
MCWRYTIHSRGTLIAEWFGVTAPMPDFEPRFNAAPTQSLPVVRFTAKDGRRHLSALRWGLVPVWAKDPAIGAKMINARSETLVEKPAFETAFRKRRCIVPADAFYEWQRTGAGK